MKNPCDKCLVSIMCSNVCDEKKKYSDYWMRQLEGLNKFFYTRGGNRRSAQAIPKEILRNRERIVKRLDDNRYQINEIIVRPYGEFG